ncbi:MAG: helix-turn-helix domain-containing protein [Bdellovibrionota bacterium]
MDYLAILRKASPYYKSPRVEANCEFSELPRPTIIKEAQKRIAQVCRPGTIERFSPEQEQRMYEINDKLEKAMLTDPYNLSKAISTWESEWKKLLAPPWSPTMTHLPSSAETDTSSPNNQIFDNRLWTVTDVADYLQVSEKTVYDWVHRRVIPFIKVNNRLLRFESVEIKKWLSHKGGSYVD